MANQISGLTTYNFNIDSQKRIFSEEQKISSKNTLVNIPPDGNCLITSILVSYFGNFYKNQQRFINEAENLFGDFSLEKPVYLNLYNIFNDLNKRGNYENLKPWIKMLRHKIANHIKEHEFTALSKNDVTYSEQIIHEINKQIKAKKQQIDALEKIWEQGTDKTQQFDLEKQIKLNNEFIEKAQNNPVDCYLSELKKDKTWCCMIELNALANITGCDIRLETKVGPLKIKSGSKDKFKENLHLEYINDNHYNCFIPDLTQERRVNDLIANEKAIKNINEKYENKVIDSTLYNNAIENYEIERKSILQAISDADQIFAQALNDYYLAEEKISCAENNINNEFYDSDNTYEDSYSYESGYDSCEYDDSEEGFACQQ